MKKLFMFISTLSALFLLSGCIFRSNDKPNTQYYDLALPTPINNSGNIQISSLHNDTPSQSRMLYRLRDNRIVHDPCNSWAQMPERILKRYLELSFPLNGNTATEDIIQTRIKLNSFEFDIESSEAVLSIKYIMALHGKRQLGQITIREKFSGSRSSEFAAAMSRAAAKTAEKIGTAAKNFHKNSK